MIMDADKLLTVIRAEIAEYNALHDSDHELRRLVDAVVDLDEHLSAGGKPPTEWVEGPDAPQLDDEPRDDRGFYVEPLGGPVPGANGWHMPDRYWQCDETCTVDCGACKGAGRPQTTSQVRRSLGATTPNPHDSWDGDL
jgi:hypothetical protein